MRALVALLVLVLTLPTLAATPSPASIRVADWRAGDAWTQEIVESSTFPFYGSQYTLVDEHVESARVELGTLRHANGHVHDVAWSNRSIQLPGYERPFLARAANDLTTGARLLSPYFLSYSYGSSPFDLLGLGVYEADGTANDTRDMERLVETPEITFYDMLGGVDLAPGTTFTRTIDLRPTYDLVLDLTFEGLALETVDGRHALRASLVQTRTEAGVASAPMTSTLWLADDLPLPLVSRHEVVAHPLAYRLETRLLAFEAGDAPLPRGSCGASHPISGRAVEPELGPVLADGPADGSLALLLPLSEAVALARSPLANPLSLPAADAIVTGGSYAVGGAARGEVASWLLEFMSDDGTFQEILVTRETDALLPMPIDRVEGQASGWWIGGTLPQPAGEAALTVADIARLADAFHEAGHGAPTISFGLLAASGGTVVTGYAESARFEQEGTASNGATRGEIVAHAFDGEGQARLRMWTEIDQTRETRVLGQPWEGPAI